MFIFQSQVLAYRSPEPNNLNHLKGDDLESEAGVAGDERYPGLTNPEVDLGRIKQVPGNGNNSFLMQLQ